MVRGRRSPGVAPRTHAEFKLPQPGFSKTIFWATLCGLHTASFLLRQLALRPGRRLARAERPIKHWEISSFHNAAGEGLCPLFGVGEPIGGRYRPGTLHEVQGQLPRPGPPNSKRLFAAMSKLRSHHLFRRRGDRSQRPARDSRCQNGRAGRFARRMKSGHRRRANTSIGGKAANANQARFTGARGAVRRSRSPLSWGRSWPFCPTDCPDCNGYSPSGCSPGCFSFGFLLSAI